MQIRTLSIVGGSMACNARCGGCIAGMTPRNGLDNKEPAVNWENFEIACQIADKGGCTTAMITGKGEPTMFPDQITKFLKAMGKGRIPIREIQTNGSYIAEGKVVKDEHLYDWYDLGLRTVCVSIVHYDPVKNFAVYRFAGRKENYSLPGLIAKLHRFGFGVRLSVVLADGYIDSVAELAQMVAFARQHRVEQLTVTPVTRPAYSESADIQKWCEDHELKQGPWKEMQAWTAANGSLLQELEHGARVYDVGGQNLCLSNCITVDPNSRETRSIIFYPDGTLRSAWQHSGSILLSGWRRFSRPAPKETAPVK